MPIPSGDTSPGSLRNYVRNCWRFCPFEIRVECCEEGCVLLPTDDDPRQRVIPCRRVVRGSDQGRCIRISDQRRDSGRAGDVPAVSLMSKMSSQVTRGPGYAREEGAFSGPCEQCLSRAERAQVGGGDASMECFVRIACAHEACRKRAHRGTRCGEAPRVGCDDNDAGSPCPTQQCGPEGIRLRG